MAPCGLYARLCHAFLVLFVIPIRTKEEFDICVRDFLLSSVYLKTTLAVITSMANFTLLQ